MLHVITEFGDPILKRPIFRHVENRRMFRVAELKQSASQPSLPKQELALITCFVDSTGVQERLCR